METTSLASSLSSLASSSSSSSSSFSSSTASVSSSLPWIEKYRPQTLSDLVAHEDITNTIVKLIDQNKLPHLLFYGPPGTGKTSTILAIARKLNGPKYHSMILELNASDERGIEVVREQIKNFASSKKLFSTGIKLIILDEADAMTHPAQAALRRVIEQYSQNTRFCLIANYINKIIPALQSRCTRFRFGPLNETQIKPRLKEIALKENVKMTEDGLNAIIKLSVGDMRKCLNIMQACHMSAPKVTEETVHLCTGYPLPAQIKSLMTTLLNESFQKAHEEVNRLQSERGYSLADIVTSLHEQVLLINMPPKVLAYCLDQLSNLEYRLSFGVNEKVQAASLVGIFQLMKDLIVPTSQSSSSSSTASTSSSSSTIASSSKKNL
eukprot:TRINITY_DN705_c0_g5_i1.p1 TRINITY_DN705_c0_g5~~TRINITY_DN705_c0_g5_i1.p1  ORF type:complete len:381 (+),score=69.28 TRINITY_DN705_c0_g5_i1:114-1256(+)